MKAVFHGGSNDGREMEIPFGLPVVQVSVKNTDPFASIWKEPPAVKIEQYYLGTGYDPGRLHYYWDT